MPLVRLGDITITASVKTRKWCLVRIVCAIGVALALPGCSRGDAPADTAAAQETTAPTDSAAPPAVSAPSPADAWQPDEERKSLPSNRIYYTLTSFPWYARGEPLLHEGRPHVPTGPLITASVEEMEKVGEYEGVEFYTRRNDPDPVLYVPVFEGYWLGFRLNTLGGAAKVAKSAR